MTEKELKKAAEAIEGGMKAIKEIGFTREEVEKYQPFFFKIYNWFYRKFFKITTKNHS